jgi:hypothetical protein
MEHVPLGNTMADAIKQRSRLRWIRYVVGASIALHDLPSFVLVEDLGGHRDTNNFVGFPARGQMYGLQ